MRNMKRQAQSRSISKKSGRVFVGMSGGVDSSVSAAMLQKAGFEVTGVFIKVWQPDWLECTWREDRRDAMRVAAHLGIPFVTLDLEKEYKKEVVDYMINEYKAGRTPNPDVMCNRYVKFGGFYDWAMKNGADFVATGHYAIVRRSPSTPISGHASRSAERALILAAFAVPKGPETGTSSDRLTMTMSADKNKDQTYFLWTLKQEQLPHILFPIGHLTKPEVRKLAKKFGLPTAEKRDSQGLCFIGKIDFKEFLKRYIPTKPGNVLDEDGKIIGTHDGSVFLTIGERHGFKVHKQTSDSKALYIISKNIEDNTVTVGYKDGVKDSQKNSSEVGPWIRSIQIKDVNWISDVPVKDAKLSARSRYRQPLQSIRITEIKSDQILVTFEKRPDYLAPGQSLVIYDGEKCLGGGIIV